MVREITRNAGSFCTAVPCNPKGIHPEVHKNFSLDHHLSGREQHAYQDNTLSVRLWREICPMPNYWEHWTPACNISAPEGYKQDWMHDL